MRTFGLVLALVSLMIFAGVASAQDLWFYYNFDGAEVDAAILNAMSGYEDPGFSGNPAVVVVDGAPEVVPGVFGNAWRFNGVDTRLNLNDFESMERVFSHQTVSVWFNVDATKSETEGNVFMIYEEGGGTNGMALLIGDDKLMIAIRDDCVTLPEQALILEAPFTDAGSWHHTAIVYDAGTLSLYLDGAEVASLETGYADDEGFDPPYIAAVSQHTSNAAIGGSQGSCYIAAADATTYFAGMIDDFRIYIDYAFSAAEIASLFQLTAVNYEGKLASTWGSIKQ